MAGPDNLPRWVPFGCGLAAFAGYLAGLCPSVWWIDTGELIAAAAALGISHAPGAGLHALLGRMAAELLPWGTLGWRVNVVSAAGGAAAVGVAAAIVQGVALDRGVHRRIAAAAGVSTGLLLASSLSLWAIASVAEIYALFLSLVLGGLYAVQRHARTGGEWSAGWAGLAFGAATTLRPTAVVFTAALLGWLLVGRAPGRRPGWKTVRWGAAGFAMGLCFWLYLLVHDGRSAVQFSDVSTVRDFAKTVTGFAFAGHAAWPDAAAAARQLRGLIQAVPSDLGWVAAVLAAVGVAFGLLRNLRDPIVAWLLLLAVDLAFAILARPFGSGLQHYALVSFAMLALCAGSGMSELLSPARSRAVRWTLVAAAAVGVALNVVDHAASCLRRGDWSADDYARAALAQAGPRSVIFCSTDAEFFPLLPFVHDPRGEARFRATEVLHTGEIERRSGRPWRERLAFEARKRRAYLAFRESDLPDGLSLIAEGPLYRVTVGVSAGDAAPSPGKGRPVAYFGDELELRSLRIEADPGARLLWLHYAWSDRRRAREPLHVVAVFTDAAGNTLIRDGEIAFHNIHPLGVSRRSSRALGQAEGVTERLAIVVPSEAAPGDYLLNVAVARSATVRRVAGSAPATPRSIYESRTGAFRGYVAAGGTLGRFESSRAGGPGAATSYLPPDLGSGALPGSRIVEDVFVALPAAVVHVAPDESGPLGLAPRRGPISVRARAP